MLAAADQHGRVQAQRRARGVGACVALVPAGAFDEIDALGATQDARLPADPEQLTVCVGDRHEAVAVLCGSAEHVVEQREHPRQRMVGAVTPQGIALEGDRRTRVVGVHPGRH
jgi:hypothetical protein